MSSLLLAHVHHLPYEEMDCLGMVGYLHPILLHFPIVLIYMTGVCELLKKREVARFLILSAGILTPLTTLTGLLWKGHMHELYHWHKLLGLATTSIILTTAVFQVKEKRVFYLLFLTLSIVLVTFTSLLGGLMTFGTPF